MRFLILLLIAVSSSIGFAIDVEAVISKMNATGRPTLIGKDAGSGFYVICRTEVSVESDVNVAREEAKLKARTTIAELFSVKVSVDRKQTTTAMESVSDEGEAFSQSEFAQSISRKDINQVQRGISVCKEICSGSKLVVYCLLTEKVMDATATLKKAMETLAPDTVQASGVGYYNEMVTKAKAHDNAVSEAQRNAIAEVLGMSMTSSSSKQTISSLSIDNNGDEAFACDDTFKCKTFSACAGFIESSRVIDEKDAHGALCVTIVAKVARDKLLDDYRSYLESMGNPGFCVRSTDPNLLSVCAGFFGSFGLRMVGNMREAAYIIDAVGSSAGSEATVTISVRDKTAGMSVLFSESGRASTYDQALAGIKFKLHTELDKFIGRANADGRKVTVRFNSYDPDEHKTVMNVVKSGLENVPGAKNVRKGGVKRGAVEFTLNYVGDAEDLADFLEKHIKTDVKRKRLRPQRGRVENTLVEFDFE